MGKMHGNVYKVLENAELVGCVDRKPEKASVFAAEFDCTAYPSLADMIAAENLDAVDICLPTYLHKDAAIEAAAAGKHVLCEKPMALTLADADAMIEATNRAGVNFMIGHCIRFWPEYALLKQAVDDKRYGELLSLNLTRYGEFPFWSSDNWLADESLSGGGALDMHIHDTDFAHYVLGEPDSLVSFGSVDARGVGQVFTTMSFGRTVVHLEGGWNLPSKTPFRMAFRAIFERGAAIMDGGPLAIYEPGEEPVFPEFPKMEAAGGGNISDLGGYYHEIKYFVDRTLAGLPLEIVTAQTSRQSLATALEEIRQVKERTGAAAK